MWNWLSQLGPGQASFVGTLTGSVLGLIALMIGALFNFRLNRKRDALLREDEAGVVAAALYSELTIMRTELASTARMIANVEMRTGKFEKDLMERAWVQDPLLYKALANKLGLLSPKHVLAITNFHSKAQSVREWLPRLVEVEGRGWSYSPLSVLDPALSAIDDIKPTLDAMAKAMGIDEPAERLNVGEAHAIAEMQRERFAEA